MFGCSALRNVRSLQAKNLYPLLKRFMDTLSSKGGISKIWECTMRKNHQKTLSLLIPLLLPLPLLRGLHPNRTNILPGNLRQDRRKPRIINSPLRTTTEEANNGPPPKNMLHANKIFGVRVIATQPLANNSKTVDPHGPNLNLRLLLDARTTLGIVHTPKLTPLGGCTTHGAHNNNNNNTSLVAVGLLFLAVVLLSSSSNGQEVEMLGLVP